MVKHQSQTKEIDPYEHVLLDSTEHIWLRMPAFAYAIKDDSFTTTENANWNPA